MVFGTGTGQNEAKGNPEIAFEETGESLNFISGMAAKTDWFLYAQIKFNHVWGTINQIKVTLSSLLKLANVQYSYMY